MARPYAAKMREVLAHLAAQPPSEGELHPLLSRRTINNIAVIHMTSDKGLCGGLNANMNRVSSEFIVNQNISVSMITVGKKGRDFMARMGQPIRAEFVDMTDRPSVSDVVPIAQIIMEDYTDGMIDQVYIAYPKFVSTAVQQPVLTELLPMEPARFGPAEGLVGYIYEPSAGAVLSHLLPRYIEMQLYHTLLEMIASEQSARMVAMRNATDAADEMIVDLTLVYNKARQEMITTELLDITAGAAALE